MTMDPMIAYTLATTGLGLLKSNEDRERASEQNAQNRRLTEWSPWTGIKPSTEVASSSSLAGPMQGAMAGLAMGQSAERNKLENDLTQKRINLYEEAQKMREAARTQQEPQEVVMPAPTVDPNLEQQKAIPQNPPAVKRGPAGKRAPTGLYQDAMFGQWL